MTAEIITLPIRRRTDGATVQPSIWRDPSKAPVGEACLDYLIASTEVSRLREVARAFGWLVPQDPRDAAIKMAAKLMSAASTMEEAIPHFAPGYARDKQPIKSRRGRAKSEMPDRTCEAGIKPAR